MVNNGMALEAYLDSIAQLAAPQAATTHGAGGLLESLSSSISLQRDGLSEAAAASYLDMLSGNSSASIARMACLNTNLVSGNVNSTVLNNSTNSGPSSLVTDANSPLAGAAHLRRSCSPNMDSYFNLTSSPLSLMSNNLSASVIDASSIAQPVSSHRDKNGQLERKRLLTQQQAGGTATCHTTSQTRRVSLPTGKKQEPSVTHKKPRPDTNPENILHQQSVQQLLQNQDPMQLQDHNQQLQALMQQHKLQNQQEQQILQSIPRFLGVRAQQQQQMMHHLQQQTNHQVSAVHPHDGGICSRRLMQYIYHLRHRPPDNSIAYWRKFVTEYYAPGAKKRWCLSLYDSIGEHTLGVFSQATMDAWHCDICGSKSGKGFEAIFEILPRLSKIKFESGVLDELLFLDFPHECRFPSGLMMLSYGKAVQESVYEQFRVVREGQLRVIFSHDLKILSWEFCARRHEELVPRRLVAPQVNQLIQVAKKYQNTNKDGESDGVSPQDLQLNCNMFVTAGRQLTRNLELLLVNDLGFSKRYVRCLQIAEVVNSMKDLMTFSRDNNIGPMESLKKYPRNEVTTNNQMKQMHEMEWLASAEALLTDKTKLMAVCPGPSSTMIEKSRMTKDGSTSGSEKAPLAGMSHHQKLPRQNSTLSAVKQEPLSIDCSSKVAIPLPVLSPQSSSTGMIQRSPVNDFPTSQLSHGSEDLQQIMIHKLLQEMMSNSNRAKAMQNANGKVKEEVLFEFDGSAIGKLSARAQAMDTVGSGPSLGNDNGNVGAKNATGSILGRRDCFKTASNSNSSGNSGNPTFIKREPDVFEKFRLPGPVPEMDHELFGNGVLNDDWDNIGWNP